MTTARSTSSGYRILFKEATGLLERVIPAVRIEAAIPQAYMLAFNIPQNLW